MGSKLWKEPIGAKIDKNVENKTYIDEKSLRILVKKYKFIFDKHTNTLYDTKRNKNVITLIKNPLNGKYDYLVDGEWLYLEAFRTKSKELLEILKNNADCDKYYLRLVQANQLERNKFLKNILNWQLGEKIDEVEETI